MFMQEAGVSLLATSLGSEFVVLSVVVNYVYTHAHNTHDYCNCLANKVLVAMG